MSTGDVGEGRVQLYMEEHGWKLIEGTIGARTQHFDLVFEKEDRVLVAQIKTSSSDDGRIRYQNKDPHKSAKSLVRAATAHGGAAIMVFVQLAEAPSTVLAKRDGHPILETTMPEATLITWADPAEFATKVEYARDDYAKGFYQYGPRKGQPLPRTGCGYPALVDEFPTLESYLARVASDSPTRPATSSPKQRAKIVRHDAVPPE